MVPSGGVERWPDEGVEPIDVRDPRVVQEPGSAHQDVHLLAAAIAGAQVPDAVRPTLPTDLGTEAEAVAQLQLIRDSIEVGPQLGTVGEVR